MAQSGLLKLLVLELETLFNLSHVWIQAIDHNCYQKSRYHFKGKPVFYKVTKGMSTLEIT